MPSDTRRPARHPITPSNLVSVNSKIKVLPILEPRIFHHISSWRSSAADSREAVRALRSCALVCRAWAPVARRYLQEAAFSRAWFRTRRQLESIINRSGLSIPPVAHPFLRAACSMVCSPLPKVPLDTAFSSFTFIELGSRGAAIACNVGDLCRTVAFLAPLQNLRLRHLAWAGSGSNHSQSPVNAHSRARPHEICIWAERDWLLDTRSAHFITWLARSGTASELMSIHFERMMLLEELLLAAVAAVIVASKGSLQELRLSVSPNLAIHLREYLY